jgi:DNA polymerase-3 subunit delta
MGKFLRANTAAVEFAPLSEQELAAWGRKEFEKAGCEIDEVTLREFVFRTGGDLRRMTNEVKKVATAALPDTRISVDLIHALVPNVREVDHFFLTDAIVAGRRGPAMAMLAKALDDGTDPLQLLGLLAYNYRRLLMSKDMMQRGVDRREVGNVLKLRYNSQEPFLAAARRVELSKLATAVEKLARTDLAIKTSIGGSGPAGARMQIETLVCELTLL